MGPLVLVPICVLIPRWSFSAVEEAELESKEKGMGERVLPVGCDTRGV